MKAKLQCYKYEWQPVNKATTVQLLSIKLRLKRLILTAAQSNG